MASSKKVFEVFVSKIPWTIASSKHAFFNIYILETKLLYVGYFMLGYSFCRRLYTTCCVTAALTLLLAKLTMCGCVFQLTLF